MWRDLVGNLLMLQDAAGLKRGVWFDTFQGNSALWSLSYEWCFYLLFIPVVRLVRPSRQGWAALVISVAGWLVFNAVPNQIALLLSYFVIWWSGVELSREYSATGRVSLSGQARSLGSLALLCLMQLAAIGLAWKAGQPLKLGIDPVLQLRHYGASLVFLLIAVVWNSRGWRTPAWLRLFALAAPISYGIYIIHLPLLAMVHNLTGWTSGPLNLLIGLPLILGAAWLLEVRFQQVVNRRWRI
jgi:peptidoglycan/LPS O-acetylase OafA/YrhL